MDSITANGASSVASEASRLRVLFNERRFSDLLLSAQSILTTQPDQRDALLFLAVAQRYMQRLADALMSLETLERHHPHFSRLYEERGRCFVDMKQAVPAIDAFTRAVNINQALLGSWRMLEGLYRLTSQWDDAALAASRVASLEQLPPEVLTAVGLFADGDIEEAESRVRAYLLKHGDHVEAMRLLAAIGIARKVYDDAELLLAAVLDLAPQHRAARREYAGVLVDVHKYAEARRELAPLLQEEPDNFELRMLHAYTCTGLGEHERAIELWRGLLSRTAKDAELHLSIGHALKTLGRRQEAIDSYRRAAAVRPDFGDAYWSLANLKNYEFTEQELARIRAAESAPCTAAFDRYHLCFALGEALEDRRDYAESFRYYERGNALKRSESNYRAEIIENNTRRQMEVCTQEFFAARAGTGLPDPSPIFIVGLPRAGSTLLEQILASHPAIEGTQELASVQQIVTILRGRDPKTMDGRYPQVLTELSGEDFQRLGRRYLADAQPYRTGKPLFIDKMPNNFRHLGLVHLMLPNARIIDARREPMACCFSNFKQLFAQGQEFSYDFEDIARYYRTYLDLMRHWDRVLPGRILRVHHEDVIEDLEGSVRRMLAFCGLDFEPRCMEFYRTERSVRTASSEQVRQPIYREGLDQWKRFEAWLGPLKDALGDAPSRYRD